MELSSNVTTWRAGGQALQPLTLPLSMPQGYNIYPSHTLGSGKISNGFAPLAAWIANKTFVAIDGYVGVFWEDIKECLQTEFNKLGLFVTWVQTAQYLEPPQLIQQIVAPYVGKPGTVWGTKAQLHLKDFFTDIDCLDKDTKTDITIVLGVGASLLAPSAHLVYFDLPKNELQLRMRAGSITNLGNSITEAHAEMYKRFYFVDWVVCNAHKKQVLNKIEILADGQHKGTANWMHAADFKATLTDISKTTFRVRPWFEPGAWGGQWMKQHITGLNKDEVNYAWSFELIVPENGIVFESDSLLLEASFDFLMFAESDAVMGDFADKFGDDFPIRFDFLDTWQGGNLSIQCHPSLNYIRENFGETITQDETYYILDCDKGAGVYLGFQDDINPAEFKTILEQSRENGVDIDITKYVQLHNAKKHDLFLIPNGTVHSAGAGNLVLEISATPYIFTFKMYDWLRLDLNGQPRAINIDHAFNNLNFERKGQKVADQLISKQYVSESGAGYQVVHLPTHQEHFYDVHRLEFEDSVTVQTNGSPHVLMLVEGQLIEIETPGFPKQVYHYAETFVVPAAAQSYTINNKGTTKAKVIKAFLKA